MRQHALQAVGRDMSPIDVRFRMLENPTSPGETKTLPLPYNLSARETETLSFRKAKAFSVKSENCADSPTQSRKKRTQNGPLYRIKGPTANKRFRFSCSSRSRCRGRAHPQHCPFRERPLGAVYPLGSEKAVSMPVGHFHYPFFILHFIFTSGEGRGLPEILDICPVYGGASIPLPNAKW